MATECIISVFVYCRGLAPGTVSLTSGRAQGDDSKPISNSTETT